PGATVSSSSRRFVPFVLAASALALASGLLRTRTTAFAARSAEADYDIPPFPANVVRPFSFGLRSVVADLMFLEAIQVYGGRPKRARTAAEGAKSDRALNRLLVYAVDLDPQFLGAYLFAGNAMPRHTSDG